MERYLPGLIMFAATFLGSGYAVVRGGPPERWGGAMFFLNAVVSNIALYLSKRQFMVPEISLMAIDVIYLITLVALALRAQRYWPLWAAAFQLDAVLTHFLMFSKATPPFSYAFALWLWSLPLPLLMAAGAWRHRRRLKLWGDDPAWT